MGLDLELLVLYDKFIGTRCALRMERDYRIFEQIERYPCQRAGVAAKVSVFSLPERALITRHGDEGLEDVTCDAYGQRLTFASVGVLRRLEWPEDVKRRGWNRAIRAFLQALPNETVVVFYWY